MYNICNLLYAGDGTWTHTVLLPQAPEACASANSATPANNMYSIAFWFRCQQYFEKFLQKNYIFVKISLFFIEMNHHRSYPQAYSRHIWSLQHELLKYTLISTILHDKWLYVPRRFHKISKNLPGFVSSLPHLDPETLDVEITNLIILGCHCEWESWTWA